MTILKKITLLSVFWISASLNASPFLNHFIQSKKDIMSTPFTHSKKTLTNYANFTGQWKGSCSDNPSDEIAFSIKATPSYLSIDNDKYDIGSALNTRNEDNSLSSTYEHTSVNWQDNGQLLALNKTIVMKIKGEGQPLNTIMVETIMNLEQDTKLIINSTAIGYQDFTAFSFDNSNHVECVFSRQ